MTKIQTEDFGGIFLKKFNCYLSITANLTWRTKLFIHIQKFCINVEISMQPKTNTSDKILINKAINYLWYL